MVDGPDHDDPSQVKKLPASSTATHSDVVGQETDTRELWSSAEGFDQCALDSTVTNPDSSTTAQKVELTHEIASGLPF